MSEKAKFSTEQIQDEVRLYVPGVVQRLAITYGGLFFLIMIVSVIMVNVLAQFIPASTANILALGTNLWLLLYGRRYVENRLHGTELFILFTKQSRERRTLENLMNEGAESDAISQQRRNFGEAAATFITTAEQVGIQPITE